MTLAKSKRYMRTRQLAEYTGISYSMLTKKRMEGAKDAPPYIKIGKSVIYDVEEVDVWMAKNRRAST